MKHIKTYFPLALLALIWLLGPILELPTPIPGAHLYLLDIVAFSSLLFSLLNFSKIQKTPLFKPLVVFVVVATFSLLIKIPVISTSQLIIAGLYLIRLISYLSFYFTFTLNKKLSLKSTSIVLLVFTLLGLVQYILLPDTRFLKLYGFDDHYFRLIGTLLDPNLAGAILAVSFFVILDSMSGAYKLISLLPLTALALTFSRSSYLSFLVGLVVLFILRFKKQYLIIIPALALLILLAPKPFGEGVNLSRTFSIQSRWSTLTNEITTIQEHPVFGVGYNTLKSSEASFPYPDRATGSLPNSYLFVLVTTGLAGLSSFLYFLFQSIKKSRSVFITSSLFVLFTHALFNNTLFYNWTLTLFLLLLSLSYRE